MAVTPDREQLSPVAGRKGLKNVRRLAPVGEPHLTGHAHADTLSFELSVLGQRVLVNSGTSLYEPGAERLRQRGTAAHNTVVVDGCDSSEVWASFRVARRARPFGLTLNAAEGASRIACGHDGYSRLRGRPVHRRAWDVDSKGMAVEDSVSGRHANAEARFHFHPGVVPRLATDAGSGTVPMPGGILRWHVDTGEARIEPATWHPEFGESLPSRCLAVRLVGGRSRVRFSWG